MKKNLLTALAVLVSLCGYAQTKGTSTLGLGVTSSTYKTESFSGAEATTSKQRANNYSLDYGYFINDNSRIGIEFGYLRASSEQTSGAHTKVEGYGGNLSYQKYYPLVKSLYAYAGGRGGYFYSTQESSVQYNPNPTYTTNQYSLGAYGGLTWFVSKRFALETTLLSANASYDISKNKTTQDQINTNRVTQKNFNLKSEGLIDGLGFKIFLLF